MKELNTVVLTHDIKETVALLTLTSADIRPMAKNELLHVRDFSPSYYI